MKRSGFFALLILLVCLLSSTCCTAWGATDGYYSVTETTSSWDGTDGSTLKSPTADYDYAYGDEEKVTYTLPWAVTFYGQSYSSITTDTNGNVWFAATNAANTFSLANTGRGPVIAAWNSDLTSSFQGGVFIQHKTNPERIVIEWQAETYTEESMNVPNNFAVVLFPDGSIRYDYNSFRTQNGDDAGSGISRGDGSASLNLTTLFGDVFTLPGRSFLFTPQALYAATVSKTGQGSGMASSSPPGIACGLTCSGNFAKGTILTLTAVPDFGSLFTGWTGPCSGTGTCTVTMDAAKTVTATFTTSSTLLPDLIVTAITPPASAVTGQLISVPVTVKNQGGDANTSFNVTLYLCTVSTSSSCSVIKTQPISSLGAGAQQIITLSATVPNVTVGAYYMRAYADAEHTISETNQFNNSLDGSQTTISYGPDLIVSAVTSPANSVTWQSISVPVTVKNQGAGSATSFKVSLYLCPTNTISTNCTFLNIQPVNSLGAGVQQTFTLPATIPAVTGGTYNIGAIADTNNNVFESDETNNTLAGSPTIITVDAQTKTCTATSDTYYTLSEVPFAWNGTSANNGSLHFGTYGDESLTGTIFFKRITFYGYIDYIALADTNGNIWYDTAVTNSAHSIDLANNGHRVISAWNNDLSSAYYGGMFSESRTTGVVWEWLTETKTDEGLGRLNNFEVVLLYDGSIRFDYKTMNPSVVNENLNRGSGISMGNGTAILDLIANCNITDVRRLSGRSFLFTPKPIVQIIQQNLSPATTMTTKSLAVNNLETVAPDANTLYFTATTTTQSLDIKNGNTGVLYVNSLSLTGPDAANFAITSNTCMSNAGFAGSETCTIQVAFTPQTSAATASADKIATLNIATNDFNNPILAIPLSGHIPQLTVAKTGDGTGGVTSNTADISCGATCTATGLGTTLILTATPSAGSIFTGWSGGGCSGTGACTVVMSSDTIVTANFDTILPWVTVNPVSNPVNTSTITLSGARKAGSSVTLVANTAALAGTITYPTQTTWQCNVSKLATGLNTFTITATNQAGSSSVSTSLTYAPPPVFITLSVPEISGDFKGDLGITLSNINPSGSEISVEQFVDTNHNGVIDAGDYLIRSFKVTDGTVSTNPNVQGDEDGTADSIITTTLNHFLANDLYHAPGSYLFRATKGTDTNTTPFTVTPVSQLQTISGLVTDGTNPVPGALVQLTDKWQRHVTWAMADNTGTYVLNVNQPGEYNLLPTAYGYVATATPVTLAASQNIVNHSLTLTAGTYHVTGQVKDATSGTGITGVWVQANGANSKAVAITNSSGAYDLLLPADTYTITALAASYAPGTSAKGYTGFDNLPLSVTVSGTTAMPDITLTAGSILASGRVLDSTGTPIPGIPVKATIRGAIDNQQPTSFGVSDATGNYSLGLFSGSNWDISLDNATAQTLGYLGTVRRDLSTTTGPLTGNDLTIHPITAWMQGMVKDSTDKLLPGVEVKLRNGDSTITASAFSAADGTYRIGAYAGNWFVDAMTENKGTHPVTEQMVILDNRQPTTLDFVVDVTPPTLTINPVATPTNVNSQTITGTNETGATITVATNTAAVAGTVSYPTSTTWNCTITGLAEGANSITVTAMDQATNSTTAPPVTINLDTTPPTVAITSPANGSSTSQTPLLTYTVSDGTVVVTVDGTVVNKVSGDTLGPLASGSHTVKVAATDPAGNPGSVQVTFTVNRPPAFSPITITKPNATVGVSYSGQTIVGAAIDPEGDPITYTKISGPAWLIVAANGTLSGTPSSPSANDSFTVQATATGGNSTATLNITVNANQPPAFNPNSITKANATVGTAYTGQTIVSAATDPEGDSITYTKVSGPAWLTVATNGTLSGTPTATDTGANSFIVQATATGGSATATLNITVTAALPAVAPLNAWTNLYSASPNNTSATNLATGSFTVGSGSNRLLLVSVIMKIGTAANPTISASYGGTALTLLKATANTQKEIVWMGYLKEAQIGTGSKALTVTYSGATGKASALHVKWAAFSNVNQTTPIASSGGTNTATTSATFGSTINYVTNGMTTVIVGNGGTPATGTLSAIPAFTAGTATTSSTQTSNSFTTGVHTASGSYASTTAITWSGTTSAMSGLVVASLQPALPNQPPAFSPTTITKPNAYVGLAYSGQTLAGAATDPDGDPITYTKVSGPAWLTIAANGALSGTPTTSANDSFTVQATATGGSATVTLNITVVVNQPPAFNPASISKPSATVGVAYTGQTIAGAAIDPEGDAITYSKVSGPAWLAVAANGALSGTPAATDIGAGSFTVRATSAGGTADATLTITVGQAVAQLNAWTNLYSAAPNNTSATNLAAGSFTVGSGSNRLLMVAIVMEIGTAANPTISASYGGTALTQLKVTNNTQREIVWVGYLKETQIGTGSKALTVTYSGATGTASALHVKWAAFSGVNQTTPVTSSGGTNTASTTATFGSTINYVTNGMTTVIAGNGGTPATGTLSATPAFTAGTATTTNAQTSRTFTTAKHTATGSYASSTPVTWSGTTSAWSGVAVVSLQP